MFLMCDAELAVGFKIVTVEAEAPARKVMLTIMRITTALSITRRSVIMTFNN